MISKTTLHHARMLLLLCCALSFQHLATAQQETPTEKPHIPLHHELGVNATSLLLRLFRGSDDSLRESPYLLTYRLSRGHFGLRVGAGGRHHYAKTSEASFSDYVSTQSSRVDARIGLDYSPTLGRRFTGTLGLDFAYQWGLDRELQDSGFDVLEITTQMSGWGGGPAVGLNFWLTRHLGIYAESTFYLIKAETDHGRIFKNFPELNDQLDTVTSTDLVTTLPTSIFLIYRF